MAEVFRRPHLAAELAARLLRPGVLDEGLRSGLFLSGLRRTGKTTFLRNDLVPELEAQGAVVIYVDLWSDTKVSPATLVQAAEVGVAPQHEEGRPERKRGGIGGVGGGGGLQQQVDAV